MNYYPYNSRDKIYRDKFGAMACGESFAPRLLLHNDARVQKVFLLIEKDAENLMEYEMQRCGEKEDYGIFEISLPLDTGIYWYYFRYESDYGTFYVIRENVTRGIVSREKGKVWQQTVYTPQENTPDWLLGGIIYQIFPDRFYNSGAKRQNIPQDRVLRDTWGETPYFEQNGTERQLGNDYFGGDLKGITEKLDYIKSLGVNCIYLNPIFEAHSNHRYNTADYFKIDPVLGNEDDFIALCKAAKKRGIHIILDGVFSHTGDDSIYFNKYRRYGNGGAYNDSSSPYYRWYKFGKTRDDYKSWWGIKTLPEVNEENEDYINFICGKDGVIEHWTKLGADGWRLDVADELPDVFLDRLNKTLKAAKKNAYILGEVWENATNKISYGVRRRYLLGDQLDSVMNYPFADKIIEYVRSGDAAALCDTVVEICDQYPKRAIDLLMNHLGTHDTARILTRLAKNDDNFGDRKAQSEMKFTADEISLAKKRLQAAAVLQFTLPGIPAVFYGDEAGLSGGADPFCRGCYPWGNEDRELLSFYRELGKIRLSATAFKNGDFTNEKTDGGLFSFFRIAKGNEVFVAVNAENRNKSILIPRGFKTVFGKKCEGETSLEPYEYLIAVK